MEIQKLACVTGESAELSVNLEWNGEAFEPGEDWTLIFTVKDSADDADVDAVFQKASGAGITVSGSIATIATVPNDTAELTEGTRIFDIKAQSVSTEKIRRLAVGELYVEQIITRENETSVPVITTETPLPTGAVGATGPTGPSGPAGSDANVTNASVNAAIEDDPVATRTSANIDKWLPQEDYGIVSGDSADAVAEANATAIATAFTASASSGKPLILMGQIYVKGEVKLTGANGTIIGHGAEIIQKDIAHNGLTMDPITGPTGIRISGLKITGQGSATHAAAGIYARNAGLTYFMSDLIVRDCMIQRFRTGISACQVAKFQTDNVSIAYVRYGMDWQAMQSAICIATRITQGDSNSAATAWKIDGSSYGTKILGGEYGGSGFARFAELSNGAQLICEGCNLELFTSAQTINITGGAYVSLKRCRIASTHAATGAVISAAITGAGLTGLPVIEWLDNLYVSSGRRIELWGSTLARTPIVYGDQVPVSFAATQGGTITQTVIPIPSSTASLDGGVPSAGTVGAGGIMVSQPSTGTSTYSSDAGLTNPLFRYYDNRRAATKLGSMLNDALIQVWAAANQVQNTTTSETDLLSATIPARYSFSANDTNHMEAFGTMAANANGKTLKIYLAGTSIIDFGSIAANNEAWKIGITIHSGSGGSGMQKVVAVLQGGATIGTIVKISQTSPTNTTSMVFKITGTATDTGDIIMLGGKAWWMRTATVLGS